MTAPFVRLPLDPALRAILEDELNRQEKTVDWQNLQIPSNQQELLGRLVPAVPGLGTYFDAAAAKIHDDGGVILQHCPVDSDLFVVLASAVFGAVDAAGNGVPARLVYAVVPRRGADGEVSADSQGTGEFHLHSDSANFPVPHAYLTLACLSSEPGHGGESLAVSADAIKTLMNRSGLAESAQLLSEPVYPYIVSHRSPIKIIEAPLLYLENAHYRIRYGRGLIEAGLQVHPLDERHQEALRDFESTLKDPSVVAVSALRPDEIWILDNSRYLHGRQAFDINANRHLKRCKIYADRRGRNG